MVNIFDLIFIGLAIFIIVRSARKGFVASALDACSVVISGLVSFKLYKDAAQWVYDILVDGLVKNAFAKVLNNADKTATFADKIQLMLEELPDGAIKLANSTGINIDALTSAMNQSVANDNDAFVELMANQIGYPVMIFVVEIVVFALLMVAASLIIRAIANFLSSVLSKLPIVGGLDSVLGGVLGIIKSIVILIVVTTIFYVIFATAKDGSILESISESAIYQFFAKYNPVISMIQ